MRYNEFRLPLVGGARIQHAEDLVFFEGSTGALRSLDSLVRLAKDRSTLTVKFDGKPALVFGRDDAGDFICTDKTGFTAKSYNGLYKSAKEFVAQKSAKGTDPEYLKKITAIWPYIEASVPVTYRGFVFGDVMYFPGELQETKDRWVFTPNTVTYEVSKDSALGKRIGQSKAGIAVHSYFAAPGADAVPLNDTAGLNLNGPLCIIGPEVKNEAPLQVNKQRGKDIKAYVKANAKAIDATLNREALVPLKLTGLPDVLYTYVNQQTAKRDLSQLYERFPSWVQANPKLSKPMVERLFQYIKDHRAGFKAIFDTFDMITEFKLDAIRQLDAHEGTVIAHIAGNRGGEGYVNADPAGAIKYVNRLGFTAANKEGNA